MKIHILTRCTRTDKLRKVMESVFRDIPEGVSVTWKVIFDTSVIGKVDSEILEMVGNNAYFWRGTQGDMGHGLLNRAITNITEGEDWVYVLDDDNDLHPDFYSEIYKESLVSEAEGFIFSQYVGGKDFTKLEIREAKPENVKVQGIDMAQFILKRKLIGEKRLVPMQYVADGIFIEELYKENPTKFHFIDKVLCNYNNLQDSPKVPWTLPRLLVMGGTNEDMRSMKAFDFESDELNVLISSNEEGRENVAKFDPDCILTIGETFEPYTSLGTLPYEFRQRWIHTSTESFSTGESAYQCGMQFSLSPDRKDLVSIFTPIYNTGEKLLRTYQSVASQTHQNWEWVLMNDSTDTITLKIAEEIASKDPRVKVYDLKEKSKGIIGEVKYRACALSKGEYLFELDHDDVILPFALEKMLEGFRAFPDAGFVFSDCAEIDEYYNSLTYGDGFCFSYGSYREETHMGITFKVANSANINPLTIRHIVGVPNHFRAWKRDLYFEIGGHNRRLSIADDYELLVRTFLKTKMVKVPLCCYLQFYHNSNSQNATRSDIQRRVRTIAGHYTDRIKARFEELGKYDWAHVPGGISWNAIPRKDDEENYVNYIL
jgi:glycosyltransferase involved in cell wall biosynthesis